MGMMQVITVDSKVHFLDIPKDYHKIKYPSVSLIVEEPIRVTLNGTDPTIDRGIIIDPDCIRTSIGGHNAISSLRMTKAQWKNAKVFASYGRMSKSEIKHYLGQKDKKKDD